jgi:hypothetical protein
MTFGFFCYCFQPVISHSALPYIPKVAKAEGLPDSLPVGADLAVTMEEATAGVEKVAFVPRLVNVPLYVTGFAPFVDSSHSSGLKVRTASVM